MRPREAIARNSHRFDPQLLEALIDFTPLDAAHLARNTDERHELDALEARLNRGKLGSPRYALKLLPATESRPAALQRLKYLVDLLRPDPWARIRDTDGGPAFPCL